MKGEVYMTKEISVHDYCDYLESEHTIEVTYQQIVAIGMTHPGAKAVDFDCEYSDDCPDPNACPVFKKASQNHRW